MAGRNGSTPTTKGTSASRTKTPEPRTVLSGAAAAAKAKPAANPTPAKAPAPAPAAKALRLLLLGAWFWLCFLDICHVLPHPTKHLELAAGDELAFARLGYPCLANVTADAGEEARLEKDIKTTSAKLKKLSAKKGKAINEENYKIAKELKSDEAKLQKQLQESSDALAAQKSMAGSGQQMCSPVQIVDGPKWLSDEFRRALPSWQVREWYTERLQTMAKRIPAAKSSGGSVCNLAEQAVRMRSQIKVDARLKGSAGMHLVLMVRDWYYYGFNVDLFARKKAALVAKGGKPTEAEVCEAVLAGSTRDNAAVTAWAKNPASMLGAWVKDLRPQGIILAWFPFAMTKKFELRTELGYPVDTALTYLALGMAFFLLNALVSKAKTQASSKGSEKAD